MASIMLRRVLFTAFIVTASSAYHPAVHAAQCQKSCGSGHRVCTLQARTAVESVPASLRVGYHGRAVQAGVHQDVPRHAGGVRAARTDCATSCPAPLAAADSCSGTCSGNAQTCLADALGAGKACVQSCPADAGLPGCWEQCAAGLRSSGATCLATLQGCLAACQGPVSGACFDTIALQCTTEACSPEHPCSQPNEFCSPRCATPQPGGTCFDPSTMQCTQQPCSPSQPCAQANQTCVPECPLPPPKGRCFDTIAKQCTDQPCAPGASCGAPNLLCTLQCPPPAPTPTPQCSSVPCGGQCVIAPPCPPGGPCPLIASLLGQCVPDSTGACQCVPPSPGPTQTPRPTPTPQCNDVPCGGTCIFSPCPPDALCPVQLGQCTPDSAGACQCVPNSPPQPTPTPQCAAVPCGGQCVIVPPCPSGVACPNFVVQGECRDDATGTCQCVPRSTPPCGADASGVCGGTCLSGAACESLPTAPGGCGCVSGVGGPCGGFIVDPPVCAAGLVCQQTNPDVSGVCVVPNCIPLFASGCSQTSDCCTPCGTAPCAVCIQGTCVGAP